jgi:hypothetical protein
MEYITYPSAHSCARRGGSTGFARGGDDVSPFNGTVGEGMSGAGFREQGTGFRAEQEPFSPHSGRDGEEASVTQSQISNLKFQIASPEVKPGGGDASPFNRWGYI